MTYRLPPRAPPPAAGGRYAGRLAAAELCCHFLIGAPDELFSRLLLS